MLSHYRIRSKFKISSDLGANIDPQVLFFKCSSQIYFFQSGNLWTKETSCLPLPKNYSDGRGHRYKIFRGQVVKGMLGQIQIKRQIIAFYVSYHKEGSSISGGPLWILETVYYMSRKNVLAYIVVLQRANSCVGSLEQKLALQQVQAVM